MIELLDLGRYSEEEATLAAGVLWNASGRSINLLLRTALSSFDLQRVSLLLLQLTSSPAVASLRLEQQPSWLISSNGTVSVILYSLVR